MNWLNSANLAGFAKTALREAQKTIDKALDIKDNGASTTEPNNTKEVEGLFHSFGLSEENEDEKLNQVMTDQVILGEPRSVSQLDESTKNITSLWESFTGSLFEDSSRLSSDSNTTLQDTNTSNSQTGETKTISNNTEWNWDWENQQTLTASDIEEFTTENNVSAANLKRPSSVEVVTSPSQSSPESVLVLSSSSSVYSGLSSSSVEILPSSEVKMGVTAVCPEDESSINESFHSSASASSSLTVISPKEDQPFDSSNEVKSNECSREVSTLLAEAIGDSLKTELDCLSASISGDEVETTTSSDIEIIASPPSGMHKTCNQIEARIPLPKTHQREPSEASSDDGAATPSNFEKMARKILELSQTLQVRETKLLDISQYVSTLADENCLLRSRLAEGEKEQNAQTDAVRRMTEDFAQRLSTLEKRYQQVVAEKELLLKQMETLKFKEDLSAQLQERDEIIDELRREGEKLSKQHLQQSNTIKKLRVKQKDDEILIKQYKDKSEELGREVDRLKKSLLAKEDLERSQIDAVRQLTCVNTQLEKELVTNKVLTREALSEAETTRSTLEQLRVELEQLKKENLALKDAETERNLSAEIALRQKLESEFEFTTQQYEDEKLTLSLRIEELSRTLAQADLDHLRESEQLRNELSRVMQRLQEAESRSDELSQALTTATRPLLRQIESLQHSLSIQCQAEERSEKITTNKFRDIECQLKLAEEKERTTRELNLTLRDQVNQLETVVKVVTEEKDQLVKKLQIEQTRHLHETENLAKELLQLKQLNQEFSEEIQILSSQICSVKHRLELELTALEAEKRKTALLQEQLVEKEKNWKSSVPRMPSVERSGSIGSEAPPHVSRGSSPTPSLSKISMSGSLTESYSSNPWVSSEEIFEAGLATPVPRSTLYDSLRAGSNTAIFESLQSQLKTREGEVMQLQVELQTHERTRETLTEELSKLVSQNEQLNQRITELEFLQSRYQDLETKYNALLQMYGEKIEENEELRLDLLDVKEMYKAQIDQLLKT